MRKKFILFKRGKYKGYSIDKAYIYKNLFYLLSIFLADEKIGKSLKGNKDPLWEIFSTEEEITHLIINCAILARIIRDQKKKRNKNLKNIVGEVTQKKRIKKLSLSEAWNKIIHAKDIQLLAKEIKRGLLYLEPKIILIGKRDNIKWKAEIDILKFIRNYIAFIK